ncbi:adenosylcobinamide-GDP ribazoletransferase [Nocardioides guangzhouensis]|uniref:Adenosylcobinamide-GDP ribazoletransferase n=1 Tax=Nocardioides guangzhouensis TaxID=2497878 RepID=A0A4Q4Z5Z0_9ACTN|nr:adenosylcobinamide-GDP ribazoletransferase [Nocardioides guangzhouensis]RYP83113.1 adenosylcobinamide-GDP ribazoletransferase [Nocardioides guangzhouensis]
MSDALRLCLGTLTALRVPAPTSVDRRTAARAMLLAPLAGLLLAVPLVLLLLLDVPPLLLAALAVAALALLTRGLHLDGLADTADGLGSGRTGDHALAVMRRSDVGPFGVVTLALVLLVQVASLAVLVATGTGPGVLLAALLVSRGVLPLLCTAAFPPARRDGLGVSFAGVVPTVAAAGSALVAVVVGLALAALLTDMQYQGPLPRSTGYFWFAGSGEWPAVALAVPIAAAVAVAAALLLARRCAARFGGLTGDTYGAGVEVAFTTMLLVPALLLP